MTPAPVAPEVMTLETAFAMWSMIIAGAAFVLSLAFGIPSLVFGARADRRASEAEKSAAQADELARDAAERADHAERRADRIEARDTERHDAEWQYRFRDGDATILDVTNTGRDVARKVLVVGDVDGVKVYEEIDEVEGGGRSTISLSFPFLADELERVRREEAAYRMQTYGLGSMTLSVTVNLRIAWSTALGSPQSVTFDERDWSLT